MVVALATVTGSGSQIENSEWLTLPWQMVAAAKKFARFLELFNDFQRYWREHQYFVVLNGVKLQTETQVLMNCKMVKTEP